MATKALSLTAVAAAQPGDTFTFTPPSASTQYHFAVSGPGQTSCTIGIWKGMQGPGHGVASNRGKNVPYVDHVCGAGSFVVTVDGMAGPYTVTVTANSWFKKVFGWSL